VSAIFSVYIVGGKNVAGTPLDIGDTKACYYHQLWNFLPSATKDYYFIQSLLVTDKGENLVIEVKDAKKAAGTPLVVNTRKTPDAPSQLWKIVTEFPYGGSVNYYFFSKLANDNDETLVLDLEGGTAHGNAGTRLVVNALAIDAGSQTPVQGGLPYQSQIYSFGVPGSQTATLYDANIAPGSPVYFPGGALGF
jgi:hypothetical protein